MLRRLTVMFVLPAFGLVSACAAPRAGQAVNTGDDAITIQVQNNTIPGTTVSVSAVSESGGRARLGTVLPGAERTFTYRPGGSGVEYRLVAERTGAGAAQLVSQPILPSESTNGVVRWELNTNNIIIDP